MGKRQLAKIDKKKAEIAATKDLNVVKDAVDKGGALVDYLKKTNAALPKVNRIQKERLLWMRQGGRLLADLDHAPAGRPRKNRCEDAPISKTQQLQVSGMDKREASRWELLSAIPDDQYEDILEQIEAGEGSATDREITTAAVLKHARQFKRAQQQGSILSACPEGQYSTIVVDPPWPIQKVDRDVRPKQDQFAYHVTTLEEIRDWEGVRAVAPKHCHLYLWTTQKHLPATFDILTAWGFKYVFTMVWHKSGGIQPHRLPQYNCEFVLFGRKGNLDFLTTKAFDCCFAGKRREHSRKPDEFYDLVRRVSPEPRIDIFSRETREGFESWGDEAGKLDA